jgi:DNA-binding transcriptional LysR family regulator
VASPAYLARHGRPIHASDLAGHDCLVYTGATEAEQWRFRLGRRWISVRPQSRFRADNAEALLKAAIAGLGIAVVPTFLAGNAIANGSLEPLLMDHAMPEGGLYVVRPPGPHVPGKVRALIEILVERFGGEPVWDRCQMHSRALGRAEAQARPVEIA